MFESQKAINITDTRTVHYAKTGYVQMLATVKRTQLQKYTGVRCFATCIKEETGDVREFDFMEAMEKTQHVKRELLI